MAISLSNPPEDFNWGAYLYLNPDVKNAGSNTRTAALTHYINHGISEGRKYILPGFYPELYLAANADLRNAFGWNVDLATQHYIDNVLSGKEKRPLAIGAAPSSRTKLVTNMDLVSQSCSDNKISARAIYLKECGDVLVPFISGLGTIKWLVGDQEYVVQNQPIVEIDKYPGEESVHIRVKAICSGYLFHKKQDQSSVTTGEKLATINFHQLPSTSISITKDSSNSKLASAASTADSLKQGSISATAGTVPKFIPSLGIKPESFDSTGTLEGDLKYALSTAHVHFQSFFNDHHVVTANGISDDIISLPCFDEGLYCSLVKEMHRYSLTEISNNHAELAKNNAGLGAMVGSFIGIISGNIFAPFLGHSYGKNLTDRGKPIEDFLPDPNLLFYQDDNSYLSWSRAQVNSPRLRRIIFNRQLSEDGKVYFRLMPAIVTVDSVFPVQLFKVNDSTYFYRPLAAGIDRNQPNYDTIRIQRKYFHLRGEGTIEKTDFEIDVYGNDVEPNEKIRLYRFTGQSLDYFYADFKIHPGSIF